MTIARRIASIQAGLSPTQLVLDWLTEAQRFDSVQAYIDDQLTQQPVSMPLDRLVQAASDHAGARTRGMPAREATEARQADIRATVFRFYLVTQCWTLTHEILAREPLLNLIVASQTSLYCSDAYSDLAPAQRTQHLVRIRGIAVRCVTELLALDAARTRVASRYLEGRSTLLPGLERAWSEQLGSSQRLASMTIRLGELDGLEPLRQEDLEPGEVRIAGRVADHVDAARVKTFDLVGDGPRVRDAIRTWLRPRSRVTDVARSTL